MRAGSGWVLALAGALLGGCSSPERAAPAPLPKAAVEPRITQLYAPQPTIARGEAAKICYGVENAKSVWISPPMHELSVALARCIEVEPTVKSTYTLTVEGGGGTRVSQEITIGVGAPRVKIVNVSVSAIDVKHGEAVTLCYTVENARSVTVQPQGYKGASNAKGCTADYPAKSMTYVVTAVGADGDRDQERVTVRVR